MTPPDDDVSFRPLDGTDVPTLTRWLNTRHVYEWWGVASGPGSLGGEGDDAATEESVSAKYGAAMDSGGAVRHLILHGTRPIGLIQWYHLTDSRGYAAEIGEPPEGTAGLDLLIGEPDMIGRGVGPRAIAAYVEEIVFADPTVTRVVAGPELRNRRSIRAFEHAGFHWVRDARVTGERDFEHVMARDR